MEDCLLEKWDDLLVELSDYCVVDPEEFKHLIFDTYCFLKDNLEAGDVVPRKLLGLYTTIVQTEFFLSQEYMEGVPHRVSASFRDCTFGLGCVFRCGFDVGYYENSLPLGASIHVPAGCAAPEADMTSYETFCRSFDENTELLIDYYDDDLDELEDE